MEPIRVFIGCGPEHWLPARVLEHSIRQHTVCQVEITPLLDVEQRIPVPPKWKAKCPTSFSLQRFLIPEACGYQGKAIYLDSDMLVLAEIAWLWTTGFPPGANVLTTGGWQSAVMLLDCERARWQIDELCQRLDEGRLKYSQLSNLRGDFASVAGALDPRWNCMDRPDARQMFPANGAFLLHYTAMDTQPWLWSGHPHGAKWSTALIEAIAAGAVSKADVLREIERGHVRPSLALLIGEKQQYSDADFVFPDHKRKAVAV